MLEAQGADSEAIKAQRAKVRAASAEVEAFCDETGRTRRRSREYTPVRATWPERESINPAEFPNEERERINAFFSNDSLTSTANGSIMRMPGDEHVDAIHAPIEQRNTGKGNPNAMAHFDRPLNNRQQRLMDQLQDFDSRVTTRKREVSLRDISALTEKTGVEYALFTRRGERMVVRGNDHMTNIDQETARKMASEGWHWSGHSHPGFDYFCLIPSDGDKLILQVFGQEQSCIVNSLGQRNTFRKDE